MAQRNAYPSKAQQRSMARSGLIPADWYVVTRLRHILHIRHRRTGEVRVICK